MASLNESGTSDTPTHLEMKLWLQKQLESNEEAVREGSVAVLSDANSRTDTPPVGARGRQNSSMYMISVLFYSTLLYSTLFYSTLLYSTLFYSMTRDV